MQQRRSKSNRYLQPHEVQYIKDNAATLTSMQLATAIGCSQPTVWAWAKKLRVKPTKSYFQIKAPVVPVCEP